jgi:MoaA/NifB/PqqE/SkfB family radical SAM enzyme
MGNELDDAEARSMLEELSAFGVEHLCISGGEPTLRSGWESILAYSLRLFRRVHFITNGRLGSRMLEAACQLQGHDRLTIAVSVDGRRPVHDARRGQGSFDRAESVLAGPPCVEREVITTVSGDNLAELDAVADLCVALGIRFWTVQPAVPAGRLRLIDSLGEEGVHRVAEEKRRIEERLRGALRINTSCLVQALAPCSRPEGWSGCPAQLVIMPDGEVVGCQLVPGRSAGNVRRNDLRSIGKALRTLAGGCNGCTAAKGLFGAGTNEQGSGRMS